MASDSKDDKGKKSEPEPHDDSLVAQIDEQMQRLELHLGKNFNTKMHQLMLAEGIVGIKKPSVKKKKNRVVFGDYRVAGRELVSPWSSRRTLRM